MKKCNIHYIRLTIFRFNGLYLWPSNSLLRIYNQFENLTLLLHFSEVLKRMLVIKYFVG